MERSTPAQQQVKAPAVVLNRAVLEYLGLTQAEQDDLYSATYDAIVKRQTAEVNVT